MRDSLSVRPLTAWREKLEFVLAQAAEAEPSGQFQLRKEIEACRTKVREFGGKS